jgi:hypothetical protein
MVVRQALFPDGGYGEQVLKDSRNLRWNIVRKPGGHRREISGG